MKTLFIPIIALLLAFPATAAEPTTKDMADAMERLMGAVIQKMENEIPKIIDQITKDMNRAADELEKENEKPNPEPPEKLKEI